MKSRNSENLNIAESYYNAMRAKEFDTMASYLHDDVQFISPLAELQGKDAVVLAGKSFGGMLLDIQIRSRFSSENQIMFAYDMILPDPIGKFRASVLMDFTDELISRIELFCDARPLEVKKEEIFSGNAK